MNQPVKAPRVISRTKSESTTAPRAIPYGAPEDEIEWLSVAPIPQRQRAEEVVDEPFTIDTPTAPDVTGTVPIQADASAASGAVKTLSDTAPAPALTPAGVSQAGLPGPLVALGVSSLAIAAYRAAVTKPDTLPPKIQSVAAQTQSTSLVLVFDEAIDASHLPPPSAFFVTTNGLPNPVTGLSVTGSSVTLKLAQAFTAGPVNVRYQDPSAGDDAGALQDLSGNDAPSFLRGIVADGYVRGAEIFLDTNRNGRADAGESTGVFTAADGSFLLPARAADIAIIAVGGVNVDTGLPQTTPLKAPAGSLVVNPLTTLVQTVMDRATESGQPISAATAAGRVASAFELSMPADLSLLSFDPLAQDNAASLAAQQAAAQLATLVNVGAAGDPLIADRLMKGIAKRIEAQPGAPVNVANLSIEDLTVMATEQGVNLSSDARVKILTVANSIAAANSLSAISTVQRQTASDTVPPAAPVLIGVLDDAGGERGLLPSGAATDDSRPTLKGTAEPGTSVQVYRGNTLLASELVNAINGEWSVLLKMLEVGSHTLSVKTVDPSGNISASSQSFNVSIIYDTTPPAAPVISSATSDTPPTVSGTAEPGTWVSLYDGPALLGIGRTDVLSGAWSITPETLSNGTHTVTARATDQSFNTGPVSAALQITVSTDLTAPPAPVIGSLSDDVGAMRGPIASSSTVDDTQPTVTGTAEPGATVKLYDGERLIGTALADSTTGAWTATTSVLRDGMKSLTARAFDTAGNGGNASTAFAFSLASDPLAPAAPTINGATGKGRVTVTGMAEPGASVDLFEGTVLIGSGVAGSGGAWSITSRLLTAGAHTLRATAIDSASNTSPSSAPFAFSTVGDPSDLLALSGGGYKALVADAAMLAGVLKHFNTDANPSNNLDVASLLNDELTISANSGSTWFVNLLAFSPSFVASLNDYGNLFSTDGTRDLWTDYKAGSNTTPAGVDGFFGVMGEQYHSYVHKYLEQLESTIRPALQASLSALRSVGDLAAFLDDSTGNIGRFILAGIADGGQWVISQLDAVLTNVPGYAALRDWLTSTFSSLASFDLKPHLGAVAVALIEGIDWNVFAQKAIFAPDETDLALRQINFYTSDSNDPDTASNRTAALATQSLVYELAISADEAAIAPNGSQPGADVVKATVTNREAKYGFFNSTYNFVPVSATSLGEPTDKPAPWLPSIASGDLSVEYDAGFWTWGVDKTFRDLDFKGLSAFLSSSISSSAGALAGSYGVLADPTSVAGLIVQGLDMSTFGNFTDLLLDYTKGFAPLVQSTRNPDGTYTAGDPSYLSTSNFIDPIEITTNRDAANRGYLRMADGGYFDNSSVTSGLSYLFATRDSSWVPNDGKEDFNITLLSFNGLGETVSKTLASRGFANIGNVAERLFKDGAQQAVSMAGIDVIDLSHPNSAIFESAKGLVSGMDQPIWSYTDTTATGIGAGFAIKTYAMEVKTIANNTMNIGAGYEGTLNLWNIFSKTDAMPLLNAGTWNDYEVMYQQIIAGLQTSNNGYVGASLFAQAVL